MRRHDRRRVLGKRAAILAGALALVACEAVYMLMGGGPTGPVFPHAPHIEEGLDCTQCHATAEDEAQAGLSANLTGCKLCHTNIDKDKPRDKTIEVFLVDDKPIWLQKTADYSGEVRFDHGKHAKAGVECAACHQPQAEGKGEGLRLRGGKGRCLECHAKTERGDDCAVCHTTLRKDAQPPDHDANWLRLHGSMTRTRISGLGETTCEQCHTEDSCNECHRVTAPTSHTNFWRRRGHGLTAAMDRAACTTCHEPDYCMRCHREAQPASHRGAFGPPGNRHCATCHLPPTGMSCGVCHENFPAHAEGPPTPGNNAHRNARSPGDCLTCHVALPHPNPGGDCRTCHR
jgi:hypothetical protein